MTAIAAAAAATDKKIYYTMMGPKYNPGATIKVIAITPPTSYTSTGDTLDLSALFKRRIYWLMFMNATCVNAGVDYVQVGYIPGAAVTDKRGGYNPATGKVVLSAGATEATNEGDYSAYGPIYAVVCGC